MNGLKVYFYCEGLEVHSMSLPYSFSFPVPRSKESVWLKGDYYLVESVHWEYSSKNLLGIEIHLTKVEGINTNE